MRDAIAPNQQPDLFDQSELGKTAGPIEKAVLEALANQNWDFRTVSGIAKETGLPEREVKEILESWTKLVRKSKVPGRGGIPLYTLRTRPVKRNEKIALIRAFLTKTV